MASMLIDDNINIYHKYAEDLTGVRPYSRLDELEVVGSVVGISDIHGDP
jgi:hypothetical protein